VDRTRRQALKSDKFAEEVGQTIGFLSEHTPQVKLYGGIAAAVLVLLAAYYFYSSHSATVRQEALAAALKVDDATVGPQAQPPLLNFPTQEAKDKARTQAFADIASKYAGTQEGAVAQMYLAAALADKGQLAEAEKAYKNVVDTAPAAYASVAKVALADVYAGQAKTAEAEKLLRDLIDHPTPFVSKEEATIHLAQAIAKSKPAEARKMLEPLRTSRTAVSRAAIAALGSIPPSNN
jgi:predicted negative regulator of RcsB-dependent stress response